MGASILLQFPARGVEVGSLLIATCIEVLTRSNMREKHEKHRQSSYRTRRRLELCKRDWERVEGIITARADAAGGSTLHWTSPRMTVWQAENIR